MRQKNVDSRLHEYPDAKMMTEIRWYPVVPSSLCSLRLRVASFDHELMLFSWLCSPITLWDTPWYTLTPSCPPCCHLFILLCAVKSTSVLLSVRHRQISWGRFTYWAVFFIQSKAAALLLAPADIQGGREEVWSFQHYMGVGILYSTKYTINLGSSQSRALCR